MYAAIGISGLLLFFGGMLTLLALVAAIVVQYIVNENKRVAEHRAMLAREEEAALNEFTVVSDSEETKE